MIKKYAIILSLLLISASCGSAKKAEKSIETGDYDTAFDIARDELYKDKHKKANQKLIPMLKEAYSKANERDIDKIKTLKKLNDPTYYKQIYSLYSSLDVRQDEVLMLQPLSYSDKEVNFKTKNYTSEISKSLKDYSEYLFNTASQQLAGSKIDAREAHKNFNELEFVNPSYVSNLGDLIRQAKMKGSSLVLLKIQNNIQQYTTQEQLVELLRISESNMNNQWVVYHDQKDHSISYDYDINIKLDQTQITPDQMNSEVIQQQARVKDGWEFIYDGNGNVMKDSLGNDMKRDKIITVQAEVQMVQQLKSSKVDGIIDIKNLRTNSLLSTTPLFGEAKFENVFAQYRGDQRAIEEKYYQALQNKEVPFPTDTEFIKYALAEFRIKMLQLLDEQNF